jgi:hypothetical protein
MLRKDRRQDRSAPNVTIPIQGPLMLSFCAFVCRGLRLGVFSHFFFPVVIAETLR